MSGLIRYEAEIPLGTSHLECPHCHGEYSVEEGRVVDIALRSASDGAIVCRDCESSGLIPRSAPPAVRRYGEALGNDHTPAPNALYSAEVMRAFGARYGVAPDAVDKSIILAIESHCRPEQRHAWPGLDRTAAEAGCAVATVKRTIEGLEHLGLIERWQERTNRARRAPVTHYSLNKFWVALAGVVADVDHGSQRADIVAAATTTAHTEPDHGSLRHDFGSLRTPKKSKEEEQAEQEPEGATRKRARRARHGQERAAA